MPISHTEFQPVARDYAIVFTTGDEGKTYAAVAVLGIAAGENLFFAGGARVTLNKVQQQDRLICVEKARNRRAGGRADVRCRGQSDRKMEQCRRPSTRSLENLNAAQLKNLVRKGFLARIYLHLLSLENFARLLERKAARREAGDTA